MSDAKSLETRMLEYEAALCEIADLPGAQSGGTVADKMRRIAMLTLGIKTEKPGENTAPLPAVKGSE